MTGRELTLNEAEWPEVRAAVQVTASVHAAVGDRAMEDHYASTLRRLDERWGDSPTGHQAGASALRALDLLISGFEDDHDARLFLTDLVHVLCVAGVQSAQAVERWTLRMIDQRANR
jgi:hypothetical protein